MQLDTKDFLRLTKQSRTLCFWDIESTGLKGDYDTILVVAIKPYNQPAIVHRVEAVGDDKRLCRDAKKLLESFDCWVSYYGRGFDIKMLNTRLLKHGIDPVEPRPHLDLYFALKGKTLLARRSQAHLLGWLGTKQKKMSVGADTWATIVNPAQTEKQMKIMVKRCVSDTEGLEAGFKRVEHLVKEVTR